MVRLNLAGSNEEALSPLPGLFVERFVVEVRHHAVAPQQGGPRELI
jgi:hypothetical protein